MNEIDMLEELMFVEPCERARLQFEMNGTRRRMNLADLKAPAGHCVWCDAKLSGRQRRWCSKGCVHAALWRATPQSPAAKAYRLIFIQNWACVGCGLSFEEELRAKIRSTHARENQVGEYTYIDNKLKKRVASDPESKVNLFQVGSNTGDKFQTDHIVPIFKGGAGIDPSNLQVLCVSCHIKKTAEERKL